MPIQKWDGSAWVDPNSIKKWNGSAWVETDSIKKWDGSAWVEEPISVYPNKLILSYNSLNGCTYSVVNHSTYGRCLRIEVNGSSNSSKYIAFKSSEPVDPTNEKALILYCAVESITGSWTINNAVWNANNGTTYNWYSTAQSLGATDGLIRATNVISSTSSTSYIYGGFTLKSGSSTSAIVIYIQDGVKINSIAHSFKV